jgi:hypothetical protein
MEASILPHQNKHNLFIFNFERTMKKQELLFLIKAIFLATPLMALLGSYLYFDPFKVLRKYDSYYESGKPSYITLNRGYVSVETFLHNYTKYKYDSVIFGNSRSIFYPVADWKKYINAKECFHFDASDESLYGIYKKFEFLHKNKVSLKNALIIMDPQLLSKADDEDDYLFKQPPLLTSESYLSFQSRFLKTYLNGNFFIPLLDFKLTGKLRPYMIKGFLLDDRPLTYDVVTNELSLDYFENMINKNKDDYYVPRRGLFYKRDAVQKYSDAVIGAEQIKQLQYIKDRLDAGKTNYRIVISPLYDQQKINSKDRLVLSRIFGADNVFDFSGINDLTGTIYNYYDPSHYRPHVCKWILSHIYK